MPGSIATGEVLALIAAFAYGLAAVAIVKGKQNARGDNGVFLSVIMTTLLSFGLWIMQGSAPAAAVLEADRLPALFYFALAGLASTVMGRTSMYRATELLGAVPASLLRRLTPVFAVLIGFLILAEVPDIRTLIGGSLILAGIFYHLFSKEYGRQIRFGPGFALGVGSAVFYALAYTLRSLGLDVLPDPALGTLIGASVGLLWFVFRPITGFSGPDRSRRLAADRGLWHIATALLLSVGQLLQFFALQSASVAAVAILGSLEVLFAAALSALLGGPRGAAGARFPASIALALAGTAILFGQW